MINVSYNTVLYRYILNGHPGGSMLNLTTAVDVPEGSVVSLDSAGLVILATASTVVLGVARHPAKAGTQLAVSLQGIVENKGTSLALTPGARVFAGAAGVLAGTGTNQVGVALTANKVLIRISI